MIDIPGASALTPPVGADDHTRGPDAAPVTLVEYGDYECPYCADAFHILRQVEEEMGNSLRFVFRNFPLTDIHPWAEAGAEAAECAALQGRFWEMHDLLYRRQDALAQGGLIQIAEAAGLNMDRFQKDMQSRAGAERVRHDLRNGIESGVQGTPTFFINGHRYTASWRAAPLLEALRAAA